jgi:hypothetical protein
MVRYTERVRAAAESLVLPGEKLLAVGRAEVAPEGIQNPFAVAVTDRRLAWCEPWTGEPRGSILLETVTQLRERDDGMDVRLALQDAEVQLRFGGAQRKSSPGTQTAACSARHPAGGVLSRPRRT